MINLGALQYLISLISHEDKMVKKAAVMCIGSAASERMNFNAVCCDETLYCIYENQIEIILLLTFQLWYYNSSSEF